jgi:hypothetical protein
MPTGWFLLAALLVVGCVGGGVSLSEREKQGETNSSSTLQDQGGTVTEKTYPPYGSGYEVKLSGAQVNDATFTHLKKLQRVAELDLSRSSITDEQMGQLNEVANLLVRLDLSSTAVTDEGLEKLTNTYVLFNLNLAGTKCTPAGVERFKAKRLASPHTRVKNPNVKLK